MPVSFWQFSETASSSASTTSSSQPVTGDGDASSPPGIISGTAQLGDALSVRIEADLQGNTGGTLDVFLQSLWLGHWYDVCHFPQLAAGAVKRTSVFTGGLNVGYSASSQQVGVDMSPALPANQIVPGPFGEALRLVMVSGTSTSAGAPVVVRVIAQQERFARR